MGLCNVKSFANVSMLKIDGELMLSHQTHIVYTHTHTQPWHIGISDTLKGSSLSALVFPPNFLLFCSEQCMGKATQTTATTMEIKCLVLRGNCSIFKWQCIDASSGGKYMLSDVGCWCCPPAVQWKYRARPTNIFHSGLHSILTTHYIAIYP